MKKSEEVKKLKYIKSRIMGLKGLSDRYHKRILAILEQAEIDIESVGKNKEEDNGERKEEKNEVQ